MTKSLLNNLTKEEINGICDKFEIYCGKNYLTAIIKNQTIYFNLPDLLDNKKEHKIAKNFILYTLYKLDKAEKFLGTGTYKVQ
jgi:hypothetical protein